MSLTHVHTQAKLQLEPAVALSVMDTSSNQCSTLI